MKKDKDCNNVKLWYKDTCDKIPYKEQLDHYKCRPFNEDDYIESHYNLSNLSQEILQKMMKEHLKLEGLITKHTMVETLSAFFNVQNFLKYSKDLNEYVLLMKECANARQKHYEECIKTGIWYKGSVEDRAHRKWRKRFNKFSKQCEQLQEKSDPFLMELQDTFQKKLEIAKAMLKSGIRSDEKKSKNQQRYKKNRNKQYVKNHQPAKMSVEDEDDEEYIKELAEDYTEGFYDTDIDPDLDEEERKIVMKKPVSDRTRKIRERALILSEEMKQKQRQKQKEDEDRLGFKDLDKMRSAQRKMYYEAKSSLPKSKVEVANDFQILTYCHTLKKAMTEDQKFLDDLNPIVTALVLQPLSEEEILILCETLVTNHKTDQNHNILEMVTNILLLLSPVCNPEITEDPVVYKEMSQTNYYIFVNGLFDCYLRMSTRFQKVDWDMMLLSEIVSLFDRKSFERNAQRLIDTNLPMNISFVKILSVYPEQRVTTLSRIIEDNYIKNLPQTCEVLRQILQKHQKWTVNQNFDKPVKLKMSNGKFFELRLSDAPKDSEGKKHLFRHLMKYKKACDTLK